MTRVITCKNRFIWPHEKFPAVNDELPRGGKFIFNSTFARIKSLFIAVLMSTGYSKESSFGFSCTSFKASTEHN